MPGGGPEILVADSENEPLLTDSRPQDYGTSPLSHTLPLNGKRDRDLHEDGESSITSQSTGLLRSSTNFGHHESLDYEIIESAIHDEDWRTRTSLERFQYTLLKWIFVLLIGASTGSVAFFIGTAVENIGGLKYGLVTSYMKAGDFTGGCLALVACNVALVFFASALCNFVAMEAAGSGIPEVKAYLNGVDTPRIFAAKTLFVKIFGSIGTVAGGLAVGKEGPLVHTGACVANILGQGGSRKYHLTWKWLRYFKNDRDRRDLVTCGAAAGVAGAFRAPVGGVLFALEEATSWWRSPLLWRVFFTNAVVAVVVRTYMSWCEGGKCGESNTGGFIIFDNSAAGSNFGLVELLPVTILGVVGGVLGSLFNHLNLMLCKWRKRNYERGQAWAKIFEACFIAALTSVLRYYGPFLAPCLPCPAPEALAGAECPSSIHAGNYRSFTCPPGHYNDLAGLLFSTNDDSIRNLFSTGTFHLFTYSSLTLYFVLFYLLSILTYGIAVPSGLFVPAIVCGATYGRITGKLMTHLLGTTRLDEGTYALLGSASFLGGSMRMTVSLSVILLELTGSLNMLPLIMIVLLVSKTIGDLFNRAIYDIHVGLKGIPYLEAHPEELLMRQVTAGEAVAGRGAVVSFAGIENVGRIATTLRTVRHNAFPLIDTDENTGETAFAGMVLRGHLLVLLQSKKAFQITPDPGLLVDSKLFSTQDFGKPGSGKGLKIEDIQLSPEEEEMFLDLHPYANRSTYIVPENMTLNKVYALFRQLGLRHLCVVPRPSQVMGVITRKDLLPQNVGERSLHSSLSGIPRQ